MTAADCPDAEGRVGRRIYSERNARSARRGRPRVSEFIPPRGKVELSVDGISANALENLRALAREDEVDRNGEFQGWACLTRDDAQDSGRQLLHRPLPRNPDHHEIHMPAELMHNREELKEHANQLAANTLWCEGNAERLASAGS